MLRVLGRASSINVRKVLWGCAGIGVVQSLPVQRWRRTTLALADLPAVQACFDRVAARPAFAAAGAAEYP